MVLFVFNIFMGKQKILIIGNSPLPNESSENRPAAGLRTFQFLESIDKNKFDIRLITIPLSSSCDAVYDFQTVIKKDDLGIQNKIQKIHDKFKPNVILGVNTYPSYIACKINTNSPIWADLNGWIMSEAQAQAYKMDSNDFLSHYYDIEKTIIKRADKLSAVSKPQMHALLGELAMMGRLNKENFSHDFVSHIPNGTEYFNEESSINSNKIAGYRFNLLWLGGYNTWVDEETLFKGVETAMQKCPKMRYLSTGGKIKGLDNKTYDRFLELVTTSKYQKRFEFLGWVDTSDIPFILKRADVGLNVDRMCTETITGARNRINEMMKFGLPVVSTLGSEISYEMAECDAGIGVKSGDAEALAEALVQMYKKWKIADLKFYGNNGKAYIISKCNYEYVCRPFIKWLENPSKAQDHDVNVSLKKNNIKAGVKYMKQNGFKKFFIKFIQKVRL